MSKIEAISNSGSIPPKNNSLIDIKSQEAESFTDAISKLKKGTLKLSSKQASVFGTVCIAFATNVLIFGKKLKLDKLGKLSPIIACATFLAGSIGLIFCAETYGKNVQDKLAKLFEGYDESPKMAVNQTSDTAPASQNITTGNKREDYKDLGLQLSCN